MTFSIVARCAKTGQFGMAVASSSPAVAARCAYARAGIGAAASQNVTDPRLGPAALDRLAAGLDAEAALDAVIGAAEHVEYRQLLIVDRDGNTAIHSGGKSLGIHTEHAARDVAAAGNLLANDTIPRAMVEAFLSSEGHLGERLITAMRGAIAAGGEAGPVHSAGMLLVDRQDWPLAEQRRPWRSLSDAALFAKLLQSILGWLHLAPEGHVEVPRGKVNLAPISNALAVSSDSNGSEERCS